MWPIHNYNYLKYTVVIKQNQIKSNPKKTFWQRCSFSLNYNMSQKKTVPVLFFE